MNIKEKRVIPREKRQKSFFTACVSHVNVNTMKRFFEQWSELQVAKGLIVHYCPLFIRSPAMSFETKGKQGPLNVSLQMGLCVTNDIVLNQVRVYHERVYADNVVSKFWFERSFSSQRHPKFIAIIATENVAQIRTKECKSFICKVNLNFLRSWGHFNCGTAFSVIVSVLNEIVLGFNDIRNGRVEARFRRF